MDDDGIFGLSTRELVEQVARRLDVAEAAGTIRVTLIFRDGRWVDGYAAPASERLSPTDLECTCQRHHWKPDCKLHGHAAAPRGGRRLVVEA